MSNIVSVHTLKHSHPQTLTPSHTHILTQVVVVSGRPGCVANARELIETAVNERLSSVQNQQTVTLTLPQRAVGRVIGRQGANIRAIQRESGAKVSHTHEDNSLTFLIILWKCLLIFILLGAILHY